MPVRARLDRATLEGRFQQALELAKQLYKDEPRPEHLKLLEDAYLSRARQQISTGHTRDAVQTLEAAARLDPTDATWQGALAEQLAAAGGVRQALVLLERLPPAEAERVRAQAVDSAVRQENAGRATLPAALHADFDRILQAFAQVAAGQDEAARDLLQGIGLRSPFQEWKVLLRGLQAYYANDDVRALEIWQRLDPNRLPFRLAAPFRARLDSAYRNAQSSAAQTALTRQYERLADSSLTAPVRAIRAAMEHRQSLAQAFRLVEGILPTLRTQAPKAVERLARCFYWAVLETGPEDASRYQRVFGAPADDPQFHRLRALAGEQGGDWKAAHAAWQHYEKDLVAHPERWPAGQLDRARALIWLRMAHNAARVDDEPPLPAMAYAFFGAPPRSQPLNPSTERCFQRSIELAPDRVEPYEALLEHLLEQNEKGKAEKTARKLLQNFPNHGPMLQKLADLIRDLHPEEALELYGRAHKANPLDPLLRSKVHTAHLAAARQEAALGQLVQARQHLEAAAPLDDNRFPGALLALRAAVAFKAGDNEQAEALLAQARAAAGAPLAISYLLMGEAVRLKLERRLKARFDKEFKEGIDVTRPAAAEAAVVARFAAAQRLVGFEYHGSKTHVKKIIGYVERVQPTGATEAQWQALTASLAGLEAGVRLIRRFAETGQRLFPNSPVFPILEARSWFDDDDEADPRAFLRIRELVTEAERLARALPPSEQRDANLKEVEALTEKLHAMNPLGMAMMSGGLDAMFGGPDDDEYDDDDDEDDDYDS